jgi:hypothetical protein
MLDILCSFGWQELLGIIMSVCVGFLYIVNFRFSSSRYIVRSRKLIEPCISFSIVNFMEDCNLSSSLSVCSIWSFHSPNY